MERIKTKILAMVCIALFLPALIPSTIPSAKASGTTAYLAVAVYNVSNDPGDVWGESVTYNLAKAIEQTPKFTVNGKSYKFYIKKYVTYNDIVNGELSEGYKLFAAPGDSDYYDDQIAHGLPSSYSNRKFRNNIKNFIENGGGYIGTCGGATFACWAHRDKEWWSTPYPEYHLQMVDAYANNCQETGVIPQGEEMEYAEKGCLSGYPGYEHGIPLTSHIKDTNLAYQVLGTRNVNKNLRYWGGPGFHEVDDADTLATYAEEPSQNNDKKIHDSNGNVIETDIDNMASILATTYPYNTGGRVVIFGQHPELHSWSGGHVEENSAYTKYQWVGGTETSASWDLIQNAAKWIVSKWL
ncbi:MAG: hypothetical protein DRN17_03910 [Thermoplasmata archaeon]|nr:MAG: hypothetical protein DRN17_03910 [Thermoplasmata archaeon]